MSQEVSQYQILGQDPNGKPVVGYIAASSYFDARKRARFHPKFRETSLKAVRRKKNFAYRVRHGNKIINGIQSAYSRQEVITALERLGFKVSSVRRHYDIRFRAATNEVVTFVGTSARLLDQKLPYNEVLQVMANNVRDKNLKAALRDIILDLRNGMDSKDAFVKQGKVFGEHTALMLGIASKSGDMKSIFKSVALLVERQAEFRKGLASSLILPAVTSVTLLGAIAFYVIYLLPKMAKLLGPMVATMPPLTASTLEISAMLQENLVLILVIGVLLIAAFYAWLTTEKGKLQLDKFIVRIPYVGRILKNTSVEIFCRVLGIIYSSGDNIEAIRIAADSSGNRFLASQIKNVAIPSMLKFGTELGKALDATEFFPDLFISRFKTAAETGAVKDTATQLADYYQMENQYAMKNLVSIIEVSITILIMIALVFLTILSSETATIDINSVY